MRTPRNRWGEYTASGRRYFPRQCRYAIQVISVKRVASLCTVVEFATSRLWPQALAEIMPVQLYRGPTLRSNAFGPKLTTSPPATAPATMTTSLSKGPSGTLIIPVSPLGRLLAPEPDLRSRGAGIEILSAASSGSAASSAASRIVPAGVCEAEKSLSLSFSAASIAFRARSAAPSQSGIGLVILLMPLFLRNP